MEFIGWIITGGVAAASVKLIESVVVWRLNRKAKLQDNQADDEEEMAQTVKTLKTAQRVILHDRIKYLGRAFIKDGAISYDDRRDLSEMHEIYHNGLGGNGHLDHLMSEVMELPLKS